MYIDLNLEVRTNAEFRYKLNKLTSEISSIENSAGADPTANDKISERIVDIYRLCKFNAGLLVPYFFPQYPYNKPLSCSARPYSYAMFHMQIGGFAVFRAGRQIGKALKINELVLTPNGWKEIGVLNVGDTVYDGKGNPTTVTGVFHQGVRPIYKMTFTDGASVECDEEHLWLCKKGGKARDYFVKSLKQIRERKGGDNPSSDQGIRIPLTEPVQFKHKTHIINPYILGLMLGDGSMTSGNTSFTTSDQELADAFDEQAGVSLKKKSSVYQYGLNNSNEENNLRNSKKGLFRTELNRLNLRKLSHQKEIPEEYLFDSIENRTELLRGLMDTDGTIYSKCQIEFYSTSKILAEQVKFLVLSLGGKAVIKTKDAYYKKDGVRINCKLCYRVKINIQDLNPFKLKRKADKFYNIRYEKTRVLKNIEYTGDHEAVCISVSSPEKTFITRDFIVTHNSTSFSARQLMYSHIIPKHRSMYVVPHQSFLDTYANRQREMERVFRFYQKHKEYRQNLKYKEYPNGSVTMLVKCLTDTQEARSKSAAEVLYDESLVKSTKVLLVEGEYIKTKEISALIAGEKVLSYDQEGNIKSSVVRYNKNKGIKNVWKIKFSNGEELICTGNTKFWTSSGWMYLCEFIPWEEANRGENVAQAKALLAIREAATPGDTSWRLLKTMGREICRYVVNKFTANVSEFSNIKDINFNYSDIQLYAYNDNNLTPTTIKSIEYAGMEEVWDIDVDEHHTFFANGIAVHNCQLLDPDFIPDIEQCQKAYNTPITIYAGTSTTVDSLLETTYQDSSQSCWFLKAPGYHSKSAGMGWLNCGDQEDVFNSIQPIGMTNPATGKVLDVTDGHFVHQVQSKFEQGYLGFHIPQIIIPDYANRPQKWMEIWNAYTRYDVKKFLQEILGIPTEEGMREITLNDLKRMCCLPESLETLKDMARTNTKYKYVISGCDWGGSDYNPAAKTKISYTVHVILGICWDGSIDILHIRQYAGMDYRSIANQICEDHAAYNAIGIASDFGVGAAYNMLLRENPKIKPERHFIFNYVGPQSALIKAPASGGWFNQYSLNRTEAITTLYDAIKVGRIRCYAWELAEERILELLNLFRVPVESPGGVTLFKYQRHGSKADDTLHALNFAYCLARIILDEPIVEDPTLRRVFQDTFNKSQQPKFFNPHGGFDLGGSISG